ncbi:MAG: hypothetical protein WCR27_00415 [Eubacteriales bacterium]
MVKNANNVKKIMFKMLATVVIVGMIINIPLKVYGYMTSAGVLKQNEFYNNKQSEQITLLLNSGLTNCQIAEIKYILWSDTDNVSIYDVLNNTGLDWDSENLRNEFGENAKKYVYKMTINKNEEKIVIKELNKIRENIKGVDVNLYFEESIPDCIDQERYLKIINADLKSKVITENVKSLTGYTPLYPDWIRTSNDKENIEILGSINTESAKKTKIAIPVLMEEF